MVEAIRAPIEARLHKIKEDNVSSCNNVAGNAACRVKMWNEEFGELRHTT